jgi:MoxR-like ATPase
MEYSPEEDEMAIVRNTTTMPPDAIVPVVTKEEIIAFQKVVRRVPVADAVVRYAVKLVRATRPGGDGAPDFVKQWLAYGASVRAAQSMILGGKARSLLQGRSHVTFDDIKALARPVLRHRLLRNFQAQSERVTTDQLVDRLLETVPLPKSGL